MRRSLAFILALLLADPSFASFTWYKSMTLSSAQSGSVDSSNWPLTVGLDGNVQAADVDLKDTNNGGSIRPDGFDIYFYSDVGLTTRLAAERVFYDGSTGKLQAHVNIPTLSHSADTIIYIAFGDSTISSDPNSDGTYGKTSTWNSNFKAVWHMEDNAANTTVADSTSNGNTGTNANNTSTKTTAAEINSGLTYVSGSSDKTAAPDIASLDNSQSGTLSAWFNFGSITAGTFEGVFIKTSSDASFRFGVDQNNDQLYVLIGGGGSCFGNTATGAIAANAWTHLVMTYDGTQTGSANRVQLYINGSSLSLTFPVSPIPDHTPNTVDPIIIGLDRTTFFDGKADEARIMSSWINSSWVTADYNSQKASSTFITWGTKTAVPKGGCVPPFCGFIGGM